MRSVLLALAFAISVSLAEQLWREAQARLKQK